MWWQQQRSEREALRTVKPKGPRWAAWSHCLACLAIFLLLNFRDQGLVFTGELVILHTIHGGGGGVMGVRNSRTGRVLLAPKDGGLTQVLAKIQEGGIPASWICLLPKDETFPLPFSLNFHQILAFSAPWDGISSSVPPKTEKLLQGRRSWKVHLELAS